jgi:hypothetical protein
MRAAWERQYEEWVAMRRIRFIARICFGLYILFTLYMVTWMLFDIARRFERLYNTYKSHIGDDGQFYLYLKEFLGYATFANYSNPNLTS